MDRGIAGRLTTRMVVLVMLALALVFGGEAWLRLRQDVTSYQADIERDHKSIARVVRVAIERTATPGQQDDLIELIEDAGFQRRGLRLNLVALDPTLPDTVLPGTPAALLVGVEVGSPVHWVGEDPDGVPWLHTTLATRSSGPQGPWVELIESMEGQSVHARATLTQALITLLLCMFIAGGAVAVLGRRLVQPRVEALEADAARSLDRALAEETLRHAAEAQLRHADRLGMVGGLAASVAHELGSPLNVVRIHGQEIAAGELGPDPELHEAGARIVQQCDRMIGLLQRLMQVARARPEPPGPVEVDALVEQTVALVRSLARRAGVTVDLTGVGVALRVQGARAELQQVLLNLLVNAVQAMPQGGVLHVTATSELAAAPGGEGGERPMVRIDVCDTGTGIAPEDLGRVFEAFFTTKPEGQGTGLGLAVCAGIVKEHGGWMAVLSELGAGSTFTVWLPLLET